MVYHVLAKELAPGETDGITWSFDYDLPDSYLEGKLLAIYQVSNLAVDAAVG